MTIIFYALLSLLIMVISCAPPPELSHKDCIPSPPPECKPGVSTAAGIDTAHLQPGYFKYHIDLLPKPINSDNNENAISFSKNIAMLSAEREVNGEKKQRIFTSMMLPDLKFEQITEIFDTEKFENVGIPIYCEADARLYFTAKAKNDDPNDYDLYTAKIVGVGNNGKTITTIQNVQNIVELNKPIYFDGQPTLSKDGLMIVFASDRAGGSGGVDLWYSKRSSVNASWNEPLPLPSEVNTRCDELSPSFSDDGKKLYFSSDGHETIGGYDIFSSNYEKGSWSKAENIGAPINTKFDEIFPYELSDSQFFYTSDQQAEFKRRNIFVLRRTYIPPKEIAAKNIPDIIQLKGKVEMPVVRDSVLPDVFVRDVAKDKEIARQQTDTIGNYSFNVEKGKEYDVGSDRKDKFYDVHRVDLRHPTDSVIIVQALVIPDTLILRINFPFDDDAHPYDFTIDDNGQKTDIHWQTSLDLLAKSIKNSSANLESVILYGHTDSLGTDEYNFALASRRANFVAKELKARGIPSRLMVIFSKGRTMPTMRRAGESDETFQLRCRRVEFVKFFTKSKMR